jgi:hypothetical protein
MSLNFSNGYIGLGWHCNESVINNVPVAYDNLKIYVGSPLGIDTTQQNISNPYEIKQSKTYRYYNFAGQELPEPKGLFIAVDQYGVTTKQYKQ